MVDVIIKSLADIGITIEEEELHKGEDINLQEYIYESILFINFILAIEEKINCELADELMNYDNIISMRAFSNMLEAYVKDMERS